MGEDRVSNLDLNKNEGRSWEPQATINARLETRRAALEGLVIGLGGCALGMAVESLLQQL